MLQGLAVGALWVVFSCAPASDRVLIQVGEKSLYRPDLEEAADRLFGEDTQLDSLGPQERQTLYRALVVGELLTLEGKARGYDLAEEVRRALAEKEAELLAQAFETRVIDAGLEVSGAEVEARFGQWGGGHERRMGHILVQTESRADSLLRLLAAGAPFEELARAHSLHAESAPHGGDMGYLHRQALPSAIADSEPIPRYALNVRP